MIHSAYLRLAAALATSVATVALAGPPPLPAPDLASRTFNGTAKVVGIAPSGYIYVAGNFTQVDGQPRNGIARLNPDGSLDAWAPTIPGGSMTVARVVENASGGVAVAQGVLFEPAVLSYIAPGSASHVVLDSEPAETYRQFTALAFDDAGSIYAAVSRNCNQGLSSTQASVRKYTGGTRDPGFAVSLTPAPAVNNPSILITSCIAAIAVRGASLYVGGVAGRSLLRVSTQTGAIDPQWTPVANRVTGMALGASHVYAGGPTSPDGARSGAGKFRLDGTGEVEAGFSTGRFTPFTGAVALDEGSGWFYMEGSASEADIAGVYAVSASTGKLNDAWDPGVQLGAGAVRIEHMQPRGTALVIGGNFSTVAGQPRAGLAAVPDASQPITGPAISIEPMILDFGNTFQSGVTRPRTFTITSRGTSDLVIQGFNFYVPQRYTHTTTCNAPLPPGASCTVTVTATLASDVQPIGFTGFTESVAIFTNGAGSLRQVALMGGAGTTYAFEGTAVQQNGIILAPTVVGTSGKTAVTLRNKQAAALQIEDIRLLPYAPGTDELSIKHDCPATLPGLATCKLEITFHPTSPGTRPALLRLAGSASGPSPVVSGQAITAEGDDDGDGLANGEEAALGRNPMLKDNDVFGDAQLFVRQQYRDILGRDADPNGLAYWSGHIANGSMTRAEALAQFLASNEFEAMVSPVTRLYLAYFLRIPDYGGLDYWLKQHRAGMRIESISNYFSASPEFQSRYGSLSDTQFVERVYSNVLGRAPDPQGQSFWTGKLATGSARGEVMIGFSESPEYRSLTSSETFVTMVYAGMLRRAPDPAGYAAWVSWLDAGNPPRGMIETVLGSPEYRSRFMP